MIDEIFISIVIPVLNEEESLDKLYKKVLESLVSYSSWEIIFVDDGSYDNSFNVIRNIVETDKRVKVIQLLKNSTIKDKILIWIILPNYTWKNMNLNIIIPKNLFHQMNVKAW